MISLPRPTLTAALGVGLSAALLAGCAGSTEAGPASDGVGASGDERISIAMLQPPRSGLTPLSDDAFKLSRWSTAETLVVLDDAGEAQEGLATAWTQTDDVTWRFEIRPDVTFHDGTPLTPEVVVASLAAAAQAAPPPRILDGVDLSIEVDPDAPDEAVLVRTGTPDPLVPQRMSSPQLVILAASAYGEDGVDPTGAGTGPFVITELNGTSTATLDRYEDYWGTPAQVSGIDGPTCRTGPPAPRPCGPGPPTSSRPSPSARRPTSRRTSSRRWPCPAPTRCT